MATALDSSAIKGVRTKYRNMLEGELETARKILKEEVSTLKKPELLKDIQNCKLLLKSYSEKLSVQMEKRSRVFWRNGA